jgi:hypothetical protein
MPDELLGLIRAAAKESDLSQQDVIRQSVRLGLPRFREQHARSKGRITNVDPLPEKVARRLYAQPDDDQDAIRLFMAAQAKSIDE